MSNAMNEIQVSVIIPVYNREKDVETAITSALNSDNVNIEVIIVNDGSTDKSGEICKNIAQKDNRIVYIEQKNGGLAAAHTTGLANVHGEYFAFLDSDDYVDSQMYGNMYKLAKENDCDMVSCGFICHIGQDIKINNHCKQSRLIVGKEEVEKCTVAMVTGGLVDNDANYDTVFYWGSVCESIFRHSFIKEHDIKFKAFWNNEDDYLFKLQCYIHAKCIYMINENYYHIISSPESMSQKIKYISNIYELRCKGREYIYTLLQQICPFTDAKYEPYRGTFQRKIIIYTLYNETTKVSPNTFKQSINYLKKVITEEKKHKSPMLNYGASKLEKLYLFFLMHGMISLGYLINKYVIKKYSR